MAAVLAIVLGGFVVVLAFGLGITDSEGVAFGGVVVFVAMLVGGGSLVAWGVRRLRG